MSVYFLSISHERTVYIYIYIIHKLVISNTVMLVVQELVKKITVVGVGWLSNVDILTIND